MKRAYRYLSEKIQSLDEDNKLSDLWESVYITRMKKHNNKQKAIISANSVVYSECLKMFIERTNHEHNDSTS
jgi:hypothetical protein